MADPNCKNCGGNGSGDVPGMGPLRCACTMQRGGVTAAREAGILEGLRMALRACEHEGEAVDCENAIRKLIEEHERELLDKGKPE